MRYLLILMFLFGCEERNLINERVCALESKIESAEVGKKYQYRGDDRTLVVVEKQYALIDEFGYSVRMGLVDSLEEVVEYMKSSEYTNKPKSFCK